MSKLKQDDKKIFFFSNSVYEIITQKPVDIGPKDLHSAWSQAQDPEYVSALHMLGSAAQDEGDTRLAVTQRCQAFLGRRRYARGRLQAGYRQNPFIPGAENGCRAWSQPSSRQPSSADLVFQTVTRSCSQLCLGATPFGPLQIPRDGQIPLFDYFALPRQHTGPVLGPPESYLRVT